MMKENIDLKTWNDLVLNMVQALWGAISPNFRRIVLDHDGVQWKLLFILEKESEADREEIDDIVGEFWALLDQGIEVQTEIKISSDFIEWPEHPARVIYQRKE